MESYTNTVLFQTSDIFQLPLIKPICTTYENNPLHAEEKLTHTNCLA